MTYAKTNIKYVKPQCYYVKSIYDNIMLKHFPSRYTKQKIYKIFIYSNVSYYYNLSNSIINTIQINSKVGYVLLIKTNNNIVITICSKLNKISRQALIR